MKKYLLLKKKNTVPWTYVISDLKVQKLLVVFIKKNCKRLIKEFRIEKVIKRKGNKLYVKRTGHNNSFNSWVDKKVLIK